MKPTVLVVDDDANMRAVLREGLGDCGFSVIACSDAFSALARLEEADALCSDIRMPGMGGLELCRTVQERDPELPVVLITGFGSMDTAVAALRAGAFDFVTKPLKPEDLARVLGRATELRRLRREVRELRRRVPAAPGGLVGQSPPMLALFDLLHRVAGLDLTVLIQGETGTGKEVVARALHERSSRAGGPFVAINCAALPESLLESELFGHVRGAFTDARQPRRGLLVEADRGTLFLDEVSEMPLGLQAKLLRAVQERKVRPLGSDREVAFDARVVAACNRDLLAEVRAGRFRSDLYYRLAVLTLEIPPLRERGNDVLHLAAHFLEAAARRGGREVTGLSPDAAARLLAWPWPGNVRELQNVMERAVALAPGARVELGDLPAAMVRERDGGGGEELLPLAEVERRHILRVLESVGGSKVQAARVLGLDRATLYRKLERFGEADEDPS